MFIFCYALSGAVTSIILLRAFQQDATTPLSDIDSWLVVFAASVLWPAIALPMLKSALLRKRLEEETQF